jgi:hypothetical protein
MSDGQIDPLELGTCLATFQTQAIAPELVPVAEARILKDMAEVVAGFEGLGEARNQVFVIAAEVAFANGGLAPRAQAALRQLRDWLKPDDFVVESALATFSRKSR